MTTVTDAMLIERCDREADAAGLKAAALYDDGRKGQAMLLGIAERFWLDLGIAVALRRPLNDVQAFVANYCRKDMSDDPRLWNRVTTRGKRGTQVAA